MVNIETLYMNMRLSRLFCLQRKVKELTHSILSAKLHDRLPIHTAFTVTIDHHGESFWWFHCPEYIFDFFWPDIMVTCDNERA